MFLKMQKRTLSFLLALILVLSTFMSVAVIPASAADDYYGVLLPGEESEETFETLTEAIGYAYDNDGAVITVLRDVDYEENCTIPSGVTLLIPFDPDHTVYNEESADLVIGEHTMPTAYCTLTMKADSSLDVDDGGVINVGSQLSATGQINGWNGAPTGPDGRILMESRSSITVHNGGSLYAWGYIYGSVPNDEVSVTIEEGATVYEPFQIKNFRGGSATLAIAGSTFPFNQYYVQNVEVPMMVEAGAIEVGFGALSASGLLMPCPLTFIGNEDNKGLFNMSDGYLIKDYIEASDRLDIKISGNSQLCPVTLDMYDQHVETSNYPLPITNNITVEVERGNLDIKQDISMLPGTQLKIDKNATMVIGQDSAIYVYDADQWNGANYVGTSTATNFISVGYTAAAGGDPGIRTNNDIIDAEIDINGYVEVKGGLYCTYDDEYNCQANIHSSNKTGSIYYATSAPSTSSLEECQNNAQSTVTVNYGVAELKKPDGSYVTPLNEETGEFVSGKYTYDSENNDLTFEVYCLVTWLNVDGRDLLYTASVKSGEVPVYEGATPTFASNDQYTYGSFIGWSTEMDSDEAVINSGEDLPPVGENEIIYYAVYDRTEKLYTVKWTDSKNNLLHQEDNVPYSQIIPESYIAPAVADVDSDSFYTGSVAAGFDAYADKAKKITTTFSKWNKPSYKNGVCTIKAAYSTATNYLVLFLNKDQDTVLDAQYRANSNKFKPGDVYQGVTPTKPSDGTYNYIFSGWKNLSDEEYPSDSDSTFTVRNCTSSLKYANNNTFVPMFTAEEIPAPTTYTITWYDTDGETVLGTSTVDPGEIPDSSAYLPADTKQDHYYWSPDVVAATENTSYTLSSEERKYTIIWQQQGDGTELARMENVPCSRISSGLYPGPTPTKPVSFTGSFHSDSDGARFTEFNGKAEKTTYSFQAWVYSINSNPTETGTYRYYASYYEAKEYLYLFLNDARDEVLASGYSKTVNTYDPISYPVGSPVPTKTGSSEVYTFNGKWKNADSDAAVNFGVYTLASRYWESKANSNHNIFVPMFDAEPISKNHSLTLNGTIGVNFYYQLPSSYTTDITTVDFSWGGTYLGPQEYDYETPNTLTDVKGKVDGSYLKFTLPLAMKELNDTVSVSVKCGDNVIIAEEYKPTDYAYNILSRDSLDNYTEEKFAQLKELVRTMLISAADAQNSFNYNTGDLATYKFGTEGFESLTTDLTPVNAETLRQLYPAENAFSDIKFYGSALNLEDETGYTLYFTVNDPSGYSVSKADVTATTTNINGEEKALDLSDDQAVWTFYGNRRLRISMKGLAAAEITNDITLTYKGTEITVNPGEYIALALEQGSDTLKNTVTALYNYNQAAIAFFGGNNG